MATRCQLLEPHVLAVRRDPEQDTASATVSLLQEWLATHEPALTDRKLAAPTEFNGTLMQWFQWYSDADGEAHPPCLDPVPLRRPGGMALPWSR